MYTWLHIVLTLYIKKLIFTYDTGSNFSSNFSCIFHLLFFRSEFERFKNAFIENLVELVGLHVYKSIFA
jgi:hypothetical protein